MKFTIGIPAYKATFLKECINSILSQTYLDFELLIVNDASPEDIDSIVGLYDTNQIRYYKNEKNCGAENVVDNWNKCLSYATGEFFILMGDDDKMCPTYLQEFVSLIEKYPGCNVFHCRTIIINENSEPVELSEPRPEFETVYDSILQRMKGSRLFFISDYVFRTKFLRENGGFYKLPLAWASDDITSFIAAEKFGIAHTNNPVFMYRRNFRTISSTGSIKLKMDAILLEEKWLVSFLVKETANDVEKLLIQAIKAELRKFIQKKKLQTIFTSNRSNKVFLFIEWMRKRNVYNLTSGELFYGLMISVKDRMKSRYANNK